MAYRVQPGEGFHIASGDEITALLPPNLLVFFTTQHDLAFSFMVEEASGEITSGVAVNIVFNLVHEFEMVVDPISGQLWPMPSTDWVPIGAQS